MGKREKNTERMGKRESGNREKNGERERMKRKKG